MNIAHLKKDCLQWLYDTAIACGIKNPILLKMALLDGPFIVRNPSSYKFIQQFEWYIDNIDYYNELIAGLDDKSVEVIDEELKRIRRYMVDHLIDLNEIYSEEELLAQKRIKLDNKKHPKDRIWSYYKDSDYGIFDEEQYRNYLDDKVVLDCGAFYGDSTLYFPKKTHCAHTYAFEPDRRNADICERNIATWWCAKKVTVVRKWVGSKNEICYMDGYGLWSIKTQETTDNVFEIVTIDSFCASLDKKVWCIKRDIEGVEIDSLMWTKETIMKDKPILIISMYHNGEQFFKMKSLIESRNVWYSFRVRKIDPFAYRQDVMLICYQA